jgi:hypothetical protein
MTPVISKESINESNSNNNSDSYTNNDRRDDFQSIYQRILTIGLNSLQTICGLLTYSVSTVYNCFTRHGQERSPRSYSYLHLPQSNRTSEADIEIGEYDLHMNEEKKDFESNDSEEGGPFAAKMTIKGLTKEYVTGIFQCFQPDICIYIYVYIYICIYINI